MQYIDRAGKQFLPTPSARRATGGPPTRPRASSHFYPRPPRGGRLGLVVPQGAVGLFLPTPSARRATAVTSFRKVSCNISTHALREEGDAGPLQGAAKRRLISTHALREEGDGNRFGLYRHAPDFYPRPPRGGRLPWSAWNRALSSFLPTPSARRATEGHDSTFVLPQISTHALREEGDGDPLLDRDGVDISTHALREEGDDTAEMVPVRGQPISTHALREEGDWGRS